ncbi:PAS domain-containing protein [Streptomyces yangpuensis]|uniref:PAS domain-containing protein n=2 Tax=Streptomyces yangpuensis TaxID=1648182 RepID=A0ABY5PTC4_9ACTN|nr:MULTISPECIES: PAS domain-containing protein [Streptomyces]UUY47251.1 PAS domain-containing protein [Streptomyces yangpuensis]
MPRRSPRERRAGAPGSPSALSTLLIGTCPGPPACTAVHTHLFVDGLDVITRSDRRMAGLTPGLLLRPGGPLHPADTPRTVAVAAELGPEPGPDRLTVRIRLRGGTVVWSGLMYPGADETVVEEVRFRPEQYLGEIGRAYAALRRPC